MLQLLALGAMAGSTLLGAYGAKVAGDNALDAARTESANYLEQARRSKIMTGVNLYRQKQYEDKIRGAQTVAIAHSGGMLDDPTSQEIFKDTAENAALDEWLIKFGGAVEESNYRQAANNALYEGKMAKATSRTEMASTLLSGAANLYTGYKTLNPGKVG